MRQVLIPLDLPPAMPLAGASHQIVALRGETMGTNWSVRFVRPPHLDAAAVGDAIQQVLSRIVQEMSTWTGDSDISIFNRAPPGTWHALPPDFANVLHYALSVARDSDGAYDPTIGALVDLWGFGAAGKRQDIPAADAIALTREKCGWRRILRDDQGRFLQPGGVSVDLSSVAKGYAVDCVAERLDRLGATHHLVEIGGELRGSGIKPDGSPWWVALEQPDAGNGPATLPETIVALHGLSVATSGDNVRWFESGGQRLSHTLDPRTGYPVPFRLASVSVLHRRCMCADALATALTVLGVEAGMRFALLHNLAARFVVRDAGASRQHLTPALAAMLG